MMGSSGIQLAYRVDCRPEQPALTWAHRKGGVVVRYPGHLWSHWPWRESGPEICGPSPPMAVDGAGEADVGLSWTLVFQCSRVEYPSQTYPPLRHVWQSMAGSAGCLRCAPAGRQGAVTGQALVAACSAGHARPARPVALQGRQ